MGWRMPMAPVSGTSNHRYTKMCHWFSFFRTNVLLQLMWWLFGRFNLFTLLLFHYTSQLTMMHNWYVCHSQVIYCVFPRQLLPSWSRPLRENIQSFCDSTVTCGAACSSFLSPCRWQPVLGAQSCCLLKEVKKKRTSLVLPVEPVLPMSEFLCGCLLLLNF